MSAQPIVTFRDGSALNAPIGGQVTLGLRFDNVPDGGGANVGYSPYINLVLPTNGADGAAAGNTPVNDGLGFLGATYLGEPLQQWVLEFPSSGQVVHPFTTDVAGNPLVVTGTPGTTLVVLRLPFGSFTEGQTPSDVEVKLDVSNLADLGTGLVVSASGGFAYGRDPLLNPVADAPVFGPATSLTVTPTVIELDKVYVGPEQETATGPSYPREWLVKALIADGQTVTGLTLTDIMPDGTEILGATIVNGTGTVSIDHATGLIVAKFDGSYTGGDPVPTLKIDFYVPEFLRDGVTPVLDPITGDFRVLENNARLDATWDPTDGRDPVEVFAIDPAGPEDIITAKSIAVQKYVAPVTTLKAGENLLYTLDGQVSNYFNMDKLVLTDTLGDGQVFDASVPVTIRMREGGETLFTGTIDPDNINVTRDPTTGISTITFDISQEMRDRGLDDAVLNGRPGGIENPATVLVTFESTIEQSYISTNPTPSNEPLVDQGDPLTNDVDFGGVVDETDRPKTDDSGADVVLPVSEVGKSIYAINGSTSLPPGKLTVAAGDEITFRLTLDMPLTGAHDVKLSDFLPLPVLRAIDGMTFAETVSAAAPAAGEAKWGPNASFVTSGDPTTKPTIGYDPVSNALTFDFGDAVAPGNPSSRIDLLFTVVVQDEEFGDGLLLTNQVTSTETNSFGTVSEDNAIVQFVLGEPELNITKGVIADTNAAALPTAALGPVTFTAPGSAGNRFTAPITSAKLDITSVDANLAGADAGDVVSFAVVVENTGSSPKGAFDVLIRDTLPEGFEVPAGGLNLRVTDGAGNVLDFTEEGGGLFSPTGGIRLADGPNQGSIGAYNATSGANIVVITYDLELTIDAPAFGAELVNTASIVEFAAMEDGIDRTDFTPAGDLSDTALVRTASPTAVKTVTATSEAHTGTLAGSDALTDATIGETVTYTIQVAIPEGRLTDFVVEDWLPISNEHGGVMTVLSARFVGVNGLGGGSIFDETPEITLLDRDGVNGRDAARFDFGDVLNTANTAGTQPATVTLEVVARVNNHPDNVAGDRLINRVNVSAEDPNDPGERIGATFTNTIEVVEPNLDVVKTAARIAPTAGAAPVTADANDTVRYTIVVENKGVPTAGGATNDFTARAWDVRVEDLLADVLQDATFLPGTLTITGIAAGRITQNASNPVDYTLDYLDPGERVTITFNVTINPDAYAGEFLDNTATAAGSSLDGEGATPTDPWDRVDTDSDAERVTIASPSVTKTIIATSDVNTRGPETVGATPVNRHGGNVDLRIGEEVTYEIRVRLPEGDSPNLRISDILEDLTSGGNGSLVYVPGSVEVVSVGSNLKTFGGAALPMPTVAVTSAGGTPLDDRITLSFQDVRNSTVNSDLAYDPENNQEFIVLRLKAVVQDLPQNNDADVLDNVGRVETGTSGSTPTTTTSTTPVRVDVVEPDLLITKTGTPVDADPSLDAGDLVNYEIRISHRGGSDAPAYDLKLDDLVPAGMQLVGGVTASVGSATVSGNAITWSLDQYLLGSATVTISYQVRLLDTVRPGDVLPNTARLVYDSNPADPVNPAAPTAAEDLASRSYNTQASATQTVLLAPTIEKSVVLTGDVNTGSSFGNAANPDAAPGETVSYLLTVTVGEGTQRLIVSDSLPEGIVFTGASVASIGSTITGSALGVGAAATSVSGGTYSFDFGTIVNAGDNDRDAGDTVTILVTGRVAATASAGTTLVNTATAETFAPGGGKPGLATDTDDAAIDVVRPDLVIVKDAAPASGGDAGDLVTYTVTLSHAAGSSAAAYLVNLSDILPPGVVLVADSARASAGTITESGGNISYSLNQYLLGADPVTITYQARLAGNIVDGQSITNTARVTYSSAPTLGASVTERDPATITTDIVNSVVKTLETTSFLGTLGSAVGIGEEVTFLVTATLGEGSQRIVLRDVLPTGLDFVDSELVSLGGITGSAVMVGADGVYDAGTRTLSFNLGDINNPFNNTSNAADQVVFRVVAKVADISGNTSGKVLDNVGAVDSSAAANPYGVTPGSSATTVTENEAVTVVRASLGGIAFRDQNGDGVRAPGETAVLAGIPVTLLNADGSATGRTAVTGADGSYLFDGLIPGSYRVQFTEVGGNELTRDNVAPDDTRDSDASVSSGITPIYTLAAGDNVRNVDAGFYLPASIGDRIWEDANGDGRQNDGASGIVGATVTLFDSTGTAVGTTVTGANGFYQFTGLAPGAYTISVLPDGFAATQRNAGVNEATDSDIGADGRSDAFTLESGTAETRLDAGFYRPVKLGGTLFEDVNGDGLQGGPGEGGISGRLVTLLDANGNPTGRTALTDPQGNYLFENLAPGTYSVRFAPDAAVPFTQANVGGDDAIDSDADPVSGRTASVTLVSGGDDRSLDAGVYRPATIGDFVWEDRDGDGQQDGDEAGIAGATVRLLDAAGNELATTISGSDGAYAFTGLAPGDYRVAVSAPGFVPTQADTGADGSDSDILADGTTAVVTLSSGEVDRSVDAGLYRLAALGDRVFLDADNDGTQDLGETGVGGVTVRLLSADGSAILGTTTTAGDGSYGFAGLAPGSYRVEFVTPADLAFAKQNQGDDANDSDADRTTGRTDIITLESGETNGTIDAGLVELGDLTGRVWVDRDGDGLEEAGEASRSNIRVNLLNADGTPTGMSTLTNADGVYLFEDLLAGSYRVEFVLPSTLRFTQADIGTDDTIDSDANRTTGVSAPVQVFPAEVTRDVDAGVYVPASLGDKVWHDLDADGLQDGNEPGLANVTVRLLAADGVTVLATTTTDGNGDYLFRELAPGEYGVRFMRPSGYEVSPRDVGLNNAIDNDADRLGFTEPVRLFSGNARTDVDAGLFQRVAIGDRVWFDANGNGRQDDGEAGARGVTVRLLDADGTVIATTVTDTEGGYAFRSLLPGTYSVRFEAPGGTAFTTRKVGPDATDSDAHMTSGRTQSITLTSGQVNNNLDAGLVRTGSIGDRVWADRNGNGRQDGSEPGIANVTVRLLNATGGVVATTTTDAGGYYTFAGLRAGTYSVAFVTPSGHTQTQADQGDDALDSDAGALGVTAPITIAPGEVVTSVDAGFIPTIVDACDLPPVVLTMGNDAFPGTAAPDKIDGLAGNDNIHGLGADDCLRGNDGDDAIVGHDGNDTLKGDAGNDNVQGVQGDDLIFGGTGDDTIEGGDGNDWIEAGEGRDNMQGEGGNDTIFAGADDDIAVGNAGDDIVFGQSGNDDIQGHDGADTLIGGTDRGQARNVQGRVVDVVLGDTVSGSGGADTFIFQRGDGVDFLLDFNPNEGDRLLVYGFDRVVLADKLMGEQTILYFGANNAVVFNNAYAQGVGAAGPFPGITFIPGLRDAPGLPQDMAPIFGGTAADLLTGTSRGEMIEGLQGNDTLLGLAGADTLRGDSGDDVLVGGVGADVLDGAAGVDTASYADASGAVRLSLATGGFGGVAAGDSFINVENVVGSAFADRLIGDGAANRLAGGASGDTLEGGAGADTLLGGEGRDVMRGDAGADLFVWTSLAETPSGTPDQVLDFSWIEGDRIDVSAIDADALAVGDQAFAFMGMGAFLGGGQGSIRVAFSGGNTQVLIDQGDGGAAEAIIRLSGLHTLAASDFVL